MSVVADFSVPAEAFCLGHTLQTIPSATVEFDRLVGHSPDYVMPFVWVLDTEREAFTTAVANDSTVESVEVSDSFGESHLYQVTWADVVSDRLQLILDHEGVLLEARGTDAEWRLWVRFGTREHFATFQDHFRQFGDVSLHHIRRPQTPGGVTFGVSAKQREALLAAYDAGYYDNPSTVTGDELAQQLSVSQQSVSRRLRRGIRTLIENTLDRHRGE